MVRARLANMAERERWIDVDLTVDSGAIYSVVPSSTLEARRAQAGLEAAYLNWPRISPPGKSPGPVFVGATPSFVCTLT